MRDDLTSLCSTVEERSDIYSAQIGSLHHHHSKMMTTLDLQFMSIETRSYDLEIRPRHDMQALSISIDRHDKRFSRFMESHACDHCEMMTYL